MDEFLKPTELMFLMKVNKDDTSKELIDRLKNRIGNKQIEFQKTKFIFALHRQLTLSSKDFFHDNQTLNQLMGNTINPDTPILFTQISLSKSTNTMPFNQSLFKNVK